MKTGYCDSEKGLTRTDRFGMSYIGILMIALVLTIAGMGKYPVCHAQDKEMLQFTAAGHVLGFMPDAFYMASGSHALRVEFVGAQGVKPVADNAADVKNTKQALPLSKVTYPNLWQGITLVYERTDKGDVESMYFVEPGVKVENIRLKYNVPVNIQTDGSLRLEFGTGNMSESPPVAWQDIGGKRVPVSVVFRKISEKEAGFSLGQYDPAFALVIDPVVQWNTFMGSSNSDSATAIAIDRGNLDIFVAGNSTATWGNPIATIGSSFIAKFHNGSLIWNTFIDSSYSPNISSLNYSHGILVTGTSQNSWGSPINTHSGDWDAFVANLDTSGFMRWNTFLGSSNVDYGFGIATDGSGNIYVLGFSHTTWGDPINPHHGGQGDTFVAKLNSNGVLQWNTFIGASNYYSKAITADSGGNVYVAVSNGDDLFHGGIIIVAKINTDGYLSWNTSIGTSDSLCNAIEVDGSGNIYVAGSSSPWGTPINPNSSGHEVFVAKFSNNGFLLWNTFMGETSSAPSIAIANSENIYISGRSHGNIWETPINTCATDNIFVAKLNDKGERQWNTCIIACNNCIVWDTSSNPKALVVDMYENIYVSGTINTTWGSPINQYSGDTDAFITKLRVPEVTISSPPVKSATVPQGIQNLILYKLNLSDAVADTTLTGVSVQAAGTYQISDILNFKLRYSANDTLDSGDSTLSMKESVASGGSLSFSGLNQTITARTTGYLFVTADISNTAVNNGTIGITATNFTNIALTETAKLGTNPIPAGGIQTIYKPPATITSITSSSSDRAYKAGDSINIKINFSEPLNLNGKLLVKLNSTPSDPPYQVMLFASTPTSAEGYYAVRTVDSTNNERLNVTEITIDGTLRDFANIDANISLPTTQNLANTKNITVDGIAPNPPSITALTPTFNSSPKWTISSGGGGSGTFRYKLDNSSLDSGASETTIAVPFDYTAPSALAQGFHTLYVQEKDAAGNWSPISSLSIQVVRTAPSVLGSPVPVTTTTPTWTWSGLTGLGGTGIFSIRLDDGVFTADPILGNIFTPSDALTQGTHTLYVKEQDSGGYWSEIGSAGITIQSPAEAIYASPNNLLIEEPGGTGEFTVRLAVRPAADVRIEMLSTDNTVCTVSPSFITLTPDNWNTGVKATVTDAPFNLVNTQGASIVFKPALSDDVYFNGKNTNMVSVTVRDDAAFTVYSVQPRYGVEGEYMTVNISGDGFDENTKVFYKPEGGIETEATRSVLGSTIINLTVPDKNQSAPPTAPKSYILRITDGKVNFEETVFVVRKADLDAVRHKKAIIVAGGGTGYSGDYLWTATRFCTDKANAALQFQGYTPSNITYLSAGSERSDKDATKENLKKAVSEWAHQPYISGFAIDELLIYMTGHGTDGGFILNGSQNTTLNAADLRQWLDDLQQNYGISRVILIYDACESGSFIGKVRKDPTAKYERIILTSTKPGQSALFADNGKLSFSDSFWKSVMNTGRLHRSFMNGYEDMTSLGQIPQIEIPSGYSYTDPDLDLKIGLGLKTAASSIDIRTVCPDVVLPCGQHSADIWVDNIVTSGSEVIDNVQARIRYNDIRNPSPDTTVHAVPLLQVGNSSKYQGTFDGFDKSGIYDVSISAMTMTDKESERVHITVRNTCLATEGDLDGDGYVTLADAIIALRIIAGINPPAFLFTDVNSDNRIGTEEVIYVLQFVAGLRQ